MTAEAVPDSARRSLSPLRRITIEHLEQSRNTAVPVSLLAECDATHLMAMHAELRRAGGARITVTALLAKTLAEVVYDHPQINSVLDGEELVEHRDVHLGLAVSVGGELAVPVIRRANVLSLSEMAGAIASLTAKARNRRLGQADVRGGTVTLSSTGHTLPGVFATPVLPPGQTAVLFAAAPVDAPVVRKGRVCVRSVLPLSLTFDHRVVNGVQALAFLQDLIQCIEGTPPTGTDPAVAT